MMTVKYVLESLDSGKKVLKLCPIAELRFYGEWFTCNYYLWANDSFMLHQSVYGFFVVYIWLYLPPHYFASQYIIWFPSNGTLYF